MVGINSDAGLVPDPEHIVNNLDIEVEALRQLAAEVRSRAKADG
jgi:hypothetical protein